MKPPSNWPIPPKVGPHPDPARVAAAVHAMRRRRTRHAQAAASAVAGVIAIAVGGIAVATTVTHGTDRLTTIGPDTPSASPSSPATPPCAASALRATYWQTPFGTLKTLTDLRLSNDGTSACTLRGWPTVSITTSSGAIFESSVNRLHAPTSPVTQDDAASSENPSPVTLPRHAYAVLYVVTEDDPNRACDTTVGQHARWTVSLPQGGGTLHLTGPPAAGCTGMPIGIFPFLPASSHPVDSSAFSPATSD